MQIHGPSHVHGAQTISGPHTTRGVQSPSSAPMPSVGDRVDISEAGQIAARLGEVPDVRADRVAEIREAILNGTYETSDKLSTAVDRLLDEIA